MLHLSRPPISPVYAQDEPNGVIRLGNHQIEFSIDNERYQRDARVEMRFVPDDRLSFTISDEGFSLPFDLIQQGSITLSLSDSGQSFEGFCIASTSSSALGGAVLVPRTSVITVTPPSKAISTAVFHLLNFPEFLGPEDYVLVRGEPPHQGWKRCGQAVLRAGGWVIALAATDETDERVRTLKAEGGYFITHMGRIEREDGSTFSSEQLCDMLSCLHFFLSFALGRWVGISFPIGMNHDGTRVFEQWGVPRVAANHWGGSCSWFDAHHSELLPQVFTGFFRVWNDPVWGNTLRSILYWYIAANDRHTGIGVDTGLLLAQIALERLAWTYCVLDRKIISSNKFGGRGFSAANKLHALLLNLSLSSAILGDFPTLQAQFPDGPQAITEIRNSLVHPRQTKIFAGDSYTEAWKLSLWYLDLVLLRICGHTGNYANRCTRRWVGEVELVP